MEDNIPLNVVVLEYKQNGHILRGTTASTTSKEEAILMGIQTFEKINKDFNYKLELLSLYSEWKPSEELENLIKKKYPSVNISYSFTEDSGSEFENEMYKIYSSNQNENESTKIIESNKIENSKEENLSGKVYKPKLTNNNPNRTNNKRKWWEFWKA